MGLIADVYALRGQRKLAVEVQVPGAIDLDAPDDGFSETRVFNLCDVFRGILVKRAAAEDSSQSSLSGRGLPPNRERYEEEKENGGARRMHRNELDRLTAIELSDSQHLLVAVFGNWPSQVHGSDGRAVFQTLETGHDVRCDRRQA